MTEAEIVKFPQSANDRKNLRSKLWRATPEGKKWLRNYRTKYYKTKKWKKARAKWLAKRPDYYRQHNIKRKTRAKSDYVLWSKLLINNVKKRCKQENIKFKLTYMDVVIPEFCPVLGSKLIRGHEIWGASIDRISPKGGYVKGNIIVVSRLANQIKSNASVEQIRAVADFYERLGV